MRLRCFLRVPFFGVLPLILLTAAQSVADSKPPNQDGEKSAAKQGSPVFERDVLPIFKVKCLGCHNAKGRKGGLDLSRMPSVRKGGESGVILDTKKPSAGLLFEMVHDRTMPPEGKPQLTKSEVDTIERWITSGAKSQAADQVAQVNQHDVLPILYLRCTVCHGLRKQEAGLDLRTKASMLKGGKSGPAIVLGKPEDSLMVKRIHTKDMPPPKLIIQFGVRQMESAELKLLTEWIRQGAPEVDIKPDVATTEPDPLVSDEDRKFWSFQPPRRSTVPTVKNRNGVRKPIDAFLLKKLEQRGLGFSPEAESLTLIRRVAFDLTGLPPTWKEVERFLADDSDDAYEKMVDRYLASPRYGERWGQYWLDLAGYADSEGKRSADPIRPHAWRYRDYVVRAFNNDKPYDRFLLEQIAGDELEDYENASEITEQLRDNLIATAFLRMAPDGTGSDIVNTVAERFEVIGDEIEVFGSVVLGLTLKCAQCHSHKYDPIPQRDYYRLMAVFKGAYDEHDWLKPSFVPGQTKVKAPGRVLSFVSAAEREEWQAAKQVVEKQIAATQAKLAQQQLTLAAKHLNERLSKLPEQLREDLRKTLDTPAKKRNEIQKYLAGKFEKQLRVGADELKKLEPAFKKLSDQTAKGVKALQAKMPREPQIRALWDRGVPSPTYIYRRGEYTNVGQLVGPGVPSALTDGKTPFDVKPPWPGSKKTGRRLALARWLVGTDHPLTARVMVNRIWYHHFGRGIVKSLSNFGSTGTPPTHPELLDWLAREFIAQKWSIKAMHRLMMNSSAYRQDSKPAPKLDELDPENELVARMPLKRMEAEVVRDSVIQVAGRLDVSQFGNPDAVKVQPDGLVTSVASDKGWRRSIYVQHRRKEMPTILENFDLPQMIPNCTERPDSTVASQALHLMNNSMIRELAASFAKRVQAEVGDDRYQQVERVYEIALSRLPSDEERQLGQQTLLELTQQWTKLAADTKPANNKDSKTRSPASDRPEIKALANYCHTIINSAAFLFID